MRETRRLKFVVLQYAPSVLSNCCVNVAVLCYEVDTGTFGDAKFLSGWEPALKLDPNADVEMLDALKKEIQSDWPDVEKRGTLLRMLLDSFSNSVQISQEQTRLTNDPEGEMRNLVFHYLSAMVRSDSAVAGTPMEQPPLKQPVKDRIGRLREEIAQIRAASSLYLQEGEKLVGAADQRRRLQRLREMFRELTSLIDWTEP